MISRSIPEPLLLTILLPMNPASNPKTIQARNDMVRSQTGISNLFATGTAKGGIGGSFGGGSNPWGRVQVVMKASGGGFYFFQGCATQRRKSAVGRQHGTRLRLGLVSNLYAWLKPTLIR